MGSSSDRLFNRQRTIHEIFGGAYVADVVLWRQKNITMGVIILTLIVWLVFEESGYTLLSLTSSILLLLITILFVWSKAASLLNRPGPSLPDMYLREEIVLEVGELARKNINALVLVCRNVALGKDSKLFFRVAACLLMISVFGTFNDAITLCYVCFAMLLTIPALYERYTDQIDGYMMSAYRSLQCIRVHFDHYISMIRKLDLDKIQ